MYWKEYKGKNEKADDYWLYTQLAANQTSLLVATKSHFK